MFHDNAYAIAQTSFPYILVTGLELFSLANGASTNKAKLRYNSSGPLVEVLQNKLKEQHLYEGIIDRNFGERTMKALVAFQKKVFGTDGADGVVGPVKACLKTEP